MPWSFGQVLAYNDLDTDQTDGDGVYEIKLFCPCMDEFKGEQMTKTWDRYEMVVLGGEPVDLIASHKCPDGHQLRGQ